MDPYLALILGILLVLSPAAPLAAAWARLLPVDDPEDRVAKDASSVLLLVGVTLCYVAQLPGVPLPLLQTWLGDRLPGDWFNGLHIAAKFLVVFVPAYAAVHAYFHRGPLRKPLLWAGILVLVASIATRYVMRFWTGGDAS